MEPLDGVEGKAGMKTSKMVALVVLGVAAWSSSAMAEETKKPARPQRVVVLDPTVLVGRRQCPMAVVDVARVTQTAPLPALKQPLADRIAGAVEKDPF
jgi:hypothetical protein